jgi:uncharacterized RDD family membrane protein YckC
MTLRAYCPNCGAVVAAAPGFCGNCGIRLASPAEGSGVVIVEYAGFWVRFVAAVLDGLILTAIGFLVGLIAGGITYRIVLGILIGITYDVGFWVANDGATPGKMAVGVKVQMANGQPIDVGPALLRYIGYLVSYITFFIGFILIGFTAQKRGLHDYIAGTIVIKSRP